MSWHSKNVRQPGVTASVLLEDMRRERDEARAIARRQRDAWRRARSVLHDVGGEDAEKIMEEACAAFDALPWAKED